MIGLQCDTCKDGYFRLSDPNPQGCVKCDCDTTGSLSVPGQTLSQCDKSTGQCACKTNFIRGSRCDTCTDTMFNLTAGCNQPCGCDPYGSSTPTCNKLTGQCSCKPNLSGFKCNKCQAGFYNLTSLGCVSKCRCDPNGAFDQTSCDIATGQCLCREGYYGISCDICKSGYWKSNFQCVKCQCDTVGILDNNNICDQVITF